MSENRVMIFTFSRAESGLLRKTIEKLESSNQYELYLVAGGMHLSRKYGYSFEQIKEEHRCSIIELPFLGDENDPGSLTAYMAEGISQLKRTLDKVVPDYFIILGDRYELLIPCYAAILYRVPIIHIHGGESTTGALDEQVRHMITKASHIHMAATKEYAGNISTMGEEDWRISVVGALGLENIKDHRKFSIKEIEKKTGIDMSKPTALCTYHPETVHYENSVSEKLNIILESLKAFGVQVIFTSPGAEVGSSSIITSLEKFTASAQDKYVFIKNLGLDLYFSCIRNASFVIGNSSSAIIEVPSFGKPSINIGKRQNGRVLPDSVINTDYSISQISDAIDRSLHDQTFIQNLKEINSPYGDGNASKYILRSMDEYSRIGKAKLLEKILDFNIGESEWKTYF